MLESTYAYVLLPILIFIARVIDVSLGTIRIIFISKGFKFLSLIIGFFEVLVWLTAINQIWSDFSNVWLYLAYAGGFATGNYVGIWLDEKICLGNALVRIIIRKNANKLIREMKRQNYIVTVLNGRSEEEETDVKVILSAVSRKRIRRLFELVNEINPKAFYTVEDLRSIKSSGYISVNEKTDVRRKFKKYPFK